ncbi:hypothetical protein E4V01_21850 [Methylorubrum sp. Q1]|uniref:hypothetical protein n=1 Tax=Methylorubrum sp. Q1 TaxID=2562453 RepID=UPI001075DEDF|nr:hypothetical protein [Methylorubrum sp. Q1]TFZ55569.1 hypothetical protein E4V01_21850 [Methylorubrum sp. Q1]
MPYSPPYKPEEDAFLREHYVKRGAAWRAERLPGRTVNSVYGRTYNLKITRSRDKAKIESSPLIDAMIRSAYLGSRPTGFITKLAKQVARPEWWVSRQAANLGLEAARNPRPWTDAEIAFVQARGMLPAHLISRQMARRGWRRTAAAIANMRTSGRMDRLDSQHFSAFALAEVMGVDGATVMKWIRNGWLEAKPRGQARTEAQRGDGWIIHERAVVAFAVKHPTRISLSKLEPNKVWFLDLMARYARTVGATGRQQMSAAA